MINLNGGWASNPKTTSPAPDLGPIGEASDYYAAWGQGRRGVVGFVNVKTDYRVRATTVRFSSR